MCALVQAVRKLKIVAAGPGLGESANPMHIIRTAADNPPIQIPPAKDSRPGTSSASSEFDASFGQRRRIAEDPATQVEDDRPPQAGYEYYGEEDIDRQLSGSPMSGGVVRNESGQQRANVEMNRSHTFGKRKKQPQDLEKGGQM